MAVKTTVLIPPKTAEATDTTQYTSTGVTTIIDKFTAANYDSVARTITVHLVEAGGSVSDSNLITKARTLQAGETYKFPEIVGHVLIAGSFISTKAGTASTISIRASGRQLT